MQPILSDNAVLRKHGNFGSPIPVTVNLLSQFVEVSDDKGDVVYHIPLQTIKKVKAKLGGIVQIKFDDHKISLSFNSVRSQILMGAYVLARNNDKAANWANTINQYINNNQAN
jgi:hypothetical protein